MLGVAQLTIHSTMSNTEYTHLKTPLDNFYHWEKTQPDKTFLFQPIDGQWQTYTYAEFGQEVRKMAGAIRAHNFPPGSPYCPDVKKLRSLVDVRPSHHDEWPCFCTHLSQCECRNGKIRSWNTLKPDCCFVGKLDDGDWAEMRQGIPSGMECVNFGIYVPGVLLLEMA